MAENRPDRGERRDVVIARVFDAPVERVWSAWTDPEQVMRWWGPTGFTSPSAAMDLREGGTSLVCMRAPKELGGHDMYSTWEYRKIVPMERMEFIHNLADKDGNAVDPATMGMPPDFPKNQLQAVSFESLDDDRTAMTVTEYDWRVGRMMTMARDGARAVPRQDGDRREGGAPVPWLIPSRTPPRYPT